MHSGSQVLSNSQVARLEERRRALNLTRPMLIEKFNRALQAFGCSSGGTSAAKMRLDRIFNSKMRRPISDATKIALAYALDWNVAELDRAIRVRKATGGRK